MKNATFPATGLLLALAALPALAPCAHAQVSVNPRALDPAAPTAQPQPGQAPARPPARPAQARPQPAAPARPAAAPEPPAPPPPVVPQAAPTPPVIPPPPAVATRPAAAPAPATIAADAPGEASPIPGGIRLTFGPARPELNQKTADAVRGLAAAIAARNQPNATFTITSLAAGTADDSSAARRLSLARGLSVRSLLIGEGVASTRIYVKAMGLATDTPPDRVDIVVANPDPPRPAAPGSASAPTPAPIPASGRPAP